MRGLKRDHSAGVVVQGHAFMQNIRRGHYELGVEACADRRIADAFMDSRYVRVDCGVPASNQQGVLANNFTYPPPRPSGRQAPPGRFS
jgi:hypothetical protein